MAEKGPAPLPAQRPQPIFAAVCSRCGQTPPTGIISGGLCPYCAGLLVLLLFFHCVYLVNVCAAGVAPPPSYTQAVAPESSAEGVFNANVVVHPDRDPVASPVNMNINMNSAAAGPLAHVPSPMLAVLPGEGSFQQQQQQQYGEQKQPQPISIGVIASPQPYEQPPQAMAIQQQQQIQQQQFGFVSPVSPAAEGSVSVSASAIAAGGEVEGVPSVPLSALASVPVSVPVSSPATVSASASLSAGPAPEHV